MSLNHLKNVIKHWLKGMEKNMVPLSLAAAGIIITAAIIISQSGVSFSGISLPSIGMSDQKIAENAIAYINNNQLSETPASLVAGTVERQSGLVKFKIDIGGNAFDSYATRDGKLLFPQVFILDGSDASDAVQ